MATKKDKKQENVRFSEITSQIRKNAQALDGYVQECVPMILDDVYNHSGNVEKVRQLVLAKAGFDNDVVIESKDLPAEAKTMLRYLSTGFPVKWAKGRAKYNGRSELDYTSSEAFFTANPLLSKWKPESKEATPPAPFTLSGKKSLGGAGKLELTQDEYVVAFEAVTLFRAGLPVMGTSQAIETTDVRELREWQILGDLILSVRNAQEQQKLIAEREKITTREQLVTLTARARLAVKMQQTDSTAQGVPKVLLENTRESVKESFTRHVKADLLRILDNDPVPEVVEEIRECARDSTFPFLLACILPGEDVQKARQTADTLLMALKAIPTQDARSAAIRLNTEALAGNAEGITEWIEKAQAAISVHNLDLLKQEQAETIALLNDWLQEPERDTKETKEGKAILRRLRLAKAAPKISRALTEAHELMN